MNKMCGCGLVACVCVGVIGESVELTHPTPWPGRPTIVASVAPTGGHPLHTHDDWDAFVALRARKAGTGVMGESMFWDQDDSALFWKEDAEPFWARTPPPTET